MTTATPDRRQRQNESNKRKRQEKRDERHEIAGDMPVCEDPELRAAVLDDAVLFLVEFFSDPPFFTDPFGSVQLDSIRHEAAVLAGKAGNINKYEPRGYGKSTRSLLLAIRAILAGHQNFVPICCSSKTKSDQLLLIAHRALSRNKKLLSVFPELYPFHALAGNPHLCKYQRFDGEKTDISIKGDLIQFARLDGRWDCEASILTAVPFENARGLNIEGYRPGAIVLDDVQKTKDARSPTAPEKLKQMVESDIQYLGSRKDPVSIINNATIIAPADLPSLMAEMEDFMTVRYKMVEAFPNGCDPEKDEWSPHWEKYFEIRSTYSKEVLGDRERASKRASLYYWWNRKEMDAGSIVTWDHAYSYKKRKEISTIQAAMNQVHASYDSFMSECQNMPVEKMVDREFLTAQQITEKQHGYEKGKVPPDVTKIFAGIDVQGEMLFYEIWAFEKDFTGYKIFDGEYPTQNARWFEKRNLKYKLSKDPRYSHFSTDEARIKQAILDLWSLLADLEFKREGDEALMTLEKIGTDTGFMGPTIEEAFLESDHKSRLILTRGYGFNYKQQPQRFKTVKRGGGKGFGWFQNPANSRGIQPLEVDTNILKSFFHKGLAISIGDPGSLSLWKDSPRIHELSGSHYKAEYRTTGDADKGWGPVDEWDEMPGKPDNDRLDTAVICLACASKEGIKSVGTGYSEDSTTARRKVNGSKWGKKR